MKSKVGLIVGGSGALGRCVVDSFKRNGWKMLNIDVVNNDKADSNYQLSAQEKLQAQIDKIHAHTLSFSQNFDSIICTAGGFDVGSIKDNDVFEKYEKLDKMCA